MGKSSTHEHISRLDALTSLLKSENFLTAQAIATELGVSLRTLHRDINLLREKGLPIDSDKGRGGGIRLHHNWGVGKLKLSASEMVDLLISMAISESMHSSLFLDSLNAVKHKLLASLSSEQKLKIHNLRNRIRVGSHASPEVLTSFEQSEKGHPEALSETFVYQQWASIQYRDEKGIVTQRNIEPHYLYLTYPVWYLFSWDTLRADFRTFRCDRILKCENVNKGFTLRPFEDFLHLLRTDSPGPL